MTEMGAQSGHLSDVSMRKAAILGRFCALIQPVIPDDLGHAQPVILEHAASAFGLRGAMGMAVAPCRDRRFIAPERQREELAGLGK